MAKPPTVTREATSGWTLAWQGRLADRVPVPVWAGLLVRLVRWCLLRPVKTAVGGVVLAATIRWGLWGGLGIGALLIGAGAILSSPGMAASGRVGRAYRACQARGRLRRAWPDLMADVGLVGGTGAPMPHGRIRPTASGLTLTAVNGMVGKTPADVLTQTGRIAGILDVHSVKARELTAARTLMVIHHRSPFAATIKLGDLPRVQSRANVCIGMDDMWDPVLLSMELSVLLLGEPGAGKSSLIWTVLDGIQHWTDQPRPELDVVDLKEGVELGSLDPARGGIATNFTKDPKDAERLIHDTVREGDRRLKLMAEHDWRKWRPEYADVLGPRRLLILDEFLALSKKVLKGDKDQDSPLKTLLFKHRASGIAVLGASQLSQVEAGGVGRTRNLFPQKVMLSMESQGMVQSIAGGDGMAEAPAHQLSLPKDAGRFYLKQEGKSGWTSGKAAFVDDEAGEHLPIARGVVTL